MHSPSRDRRIVLKPPGKRGARLLIEVFPHIADRVVKAVLEGAPLMLACHQGKISQQTLFNYINAGEEVAARRDEAFAKGEPIEFTPSELTVLEFMERIRGAQAEANRREVGFISVAAKRDWKAAAFLQQHKNPKAWPLRISSGGTAIAGPSATVTQDGTKQTVTFSWHDGTPDPDEP